MTLLHGLCFTFVAPPLVAGIYYWTLALLALVRRPRFEIADAPPVTRFAIVIPAHNEASGIAATLQSCREIDYPADLVRIVVLADNCTDATAAIARREGVEVLERWDSKLCGKGHALAWGLPQVLASRPDAVVLLDADCTIDRHALRAFAARLVAGQEVLQARLVTANPDDTPVSYAAAVGNVLENDLFYAPKDRLGGAVLLRGSGMVFAADVLRAHPWSAFSLVEDSEFSLTLLRAGLAIRWVGEVNVRSDAAIDSSQLKVQRRRWAAVLARPDQPATVPGSVWRCWEARLTRLVLSRPLVLGMTLLAAVVAAGGYLWQPDPVSAVLAATGAAILLLQGLYVLLGVIMLGITPRRIRLLAATPAMVFKLVGIAIRGAAGSGPRAWIRTPRTSTPHAGEAA